ncbi:MAG TPA: alpha-ketoacid dehydrogenase subunit beta [Chloroflexota bacterium]|nr:alpha-ketoacid dehydrogenase subunit beta [Chloroflexota bacterium]
MAQITVREAIKQALIEEMERDDRVFIMGEDIDAYGGSYAITGGLSKRFGTHRVLDTPISETVIVGAGCGAAMGGLRPIVELMTINFSLVAMDQIINNVAKLHSMFGGQIRVPMVIRAPAGWTQLAATHSQSLEAWFAHTPGLKVVMPSTPYDHKGLLKAAIRDEDPVMFIEHTLLYGTFKGEVPDGDYLVPIGKSDVKRSGKDLTIVTYSRMVQLGLKVADTLAKEGIDVEIIDLRTLRPLDMAPVYESVAKTNRALILEEDWRSYGVGAEIAARIQEECFDDLDAPVKRLGQAEVPLPYSRPLERLAFPDEEQVSAAIRDLVA